MNDANRLLKRIPKNFERNLQFQSKFFSSSFSVHGVLTGASCFMVGLDVEGLMMIISSFLVRWGLKRSSHFWSFFDRGKGAVLTERDLRRLQQRTIKKQTTIIIMIRNRTPSTTAAISPERR